MTTAFTSLKRKYPKAPAKDQLPYWVEILLVDEQGDAVAGIPWKVESHHPTDGRIDQFTFSGSSDAEGLIRIDMPHGLELKLTLSADPLAKEMEKRILRPGRDAEIDSTVRQPAEDDGYVWHYAVLGELCSEPPSSFTLNSGEVWPPFHFPAGSSFKGFTLRTNDLEKRHVIEICPFRAWELVLHHQNEYSIVNAINLGASASLAYADDNALDIVSITRFFINQCQDLSRLPQVHKSGDTYNALVQDVPFTARYHPPVFLDTSVNTDNSGQTTNQDDSTKPDGDTQLFYVYNTDKVIVSWRGTASTYNAGTDLAFSPIDAESCNKQKTQCSTLISVGKVHDGFWSAYSRVEKKFKKEIQVLNDLTEQLSLFICGHSLGGALALIHSVVLKNSQPLLYTYGMPRTFTRDAIAQLSDIVHFRHVNDNDPVPAVPPDDNLDNYLYKLWGPIGKTLGMLWSIGEAIVSPAIQWGDCFWHHGNPVVFLTATQSREWKSFKNPVGGITLKRLLPIKVKLYLVPALIQQEIQDAGQKQKEFNASLTQESLHKVFPQGGNPSRGFDITFGDHFMTSYMPYISNKLLQLIDDEGLIDNKNFTEHLYNLDLFKEQMEINKDEIPEKELERNELFLDVEDVLSLSLKTTLAMPQGNDSLVRFTLYTEEVMENAN
ncbi:lipase family protein [Enterobacter asburiae]|uniref:lipase family protein n=1 Tax=Enterobacter asburiae TaxID=61645 RepID=UPI003F558A55